MKKVKLIAFALIIFVIEAQLPPPAPIPGVKIGLANVITLVTLVIFGRKEAFFVLVARIISGSIFTGNFMSFLYSISGGIICFATMSVLICVFDDERLWVVSIFGTIAHNTAQIALAAFLTSTPQVFWYLPILLVSAIITGAFTGLVAAALVKCGPIKRMRQNNKQ